MSEMQQTNENKCKKVKFAVGLVLTIAVILFIYFLVGTVFKCKTYVPGGQTAELTFIYDDKNISVTLSDEESKTLKEIFTDNELYFDNPSCGFAENVSISFGNQKFCVANDGCGIVENGMKYFQISESERETVDKIFTAHGGRFPCV